MNIIVTSFHILTNSATTEGERPVGRGNPILGVGPWIGRQSAGPPNHDQPVNNWATMDQPTDDDDGEVRMRTMETVLKIQILSHTARRSDNGLK